MQRRSAFASRTNFGFFERQERRIPPEIFSREQAVHSEIPPLVSGEQRAAAIAGVHQPDLVVLRTHGALKERGAHIAVMPGGSIPFVPRCLYVRPRIRYEGWRSPNGLETF